MKFLQKSFLLILLLPLPVMATQSIIQAGTLIGLMHGVYAGSTTFAELAKISDFGIGTNNGLQGELVVINGKFYLADEKGDVKELSLTDKTPYAIMAEFTPQKQFNVKNISSIAELEKAIAPHLSGDNLFYAMRVDGKFSYIKARSIKAPTKPYPPLEQLTKTNQQIFELNDLQATLLIFKSPSFSSPISVPGYHIHFISADRKKAGHIFDIKMIDATVQVMQTNQFNLILPTTQEYQQANLTPVENSVIHKIESASKQQPN